jgi:hypothetical protein
VRAEAMKAGGAVVALLTMTSMQPETRATLTERVKQLTRTSTWTQVSAVPVRFRTWHPQGMAKIGDRLIVSSVDVLRPTRRLSQSAGGYDRDTGEGVGRLFAMDLAGNVIGRATLGEGAIYHPGGMDYDGTHLWVPVAEYRPNSRSIVYRVDPATLQATEVLRVADHLGAIVHNTDDHTLHGISWGSRRFYRWTLDAGGRVTNASTSLEAVRRLNPSHYVDYQDCKYVGERRMLCTGVAEMRRPSDATPFRLGGLDLVDLVDGRPVHQAPVPLWTPNGLDMTHNPVWIEPHGTGLRAYFMPEDDTSTLYIYDVDTASSPR